MRYAVASAIVALLFAASSTAAQEASGSNADSSVTARSRTAGDSLKIEVSPELQKALDELAATLDRVGRRIATDPELRASAVRAAQSFIGLTQLVVAQQADVLQEALKAAAERIAAMQIQSQHP